MVGRYKMYVFGRRYPGPKARSNGAFRSKVFVLRRTYAGCCDLGGLSVPAYGGDGVGAAARSCMHTQGEGEASG